ARSLACQLLCLSGCRRLHRDRELYDEARALARERLGADAAAVGLQESAGDRQAEPRSVSAALPRAIEGLKDALELVPGDAGALVGDPQDHEAVRGASSYHDRSGAREVARVLE